MVLNNNQPNTMVSADLSFLIKSSVNSLKFSWTSSGNTSGYILVSVELVKILTVDERVGYIIKKANPVKPSKMKVFESLDVSVNNDAKDDELESTSEIISLRDPLSLIRIDKPGRSTDCKHLQFFDLKTYFTLNVNSQQFTCPVCNKPRPWSTLYCDQTYLAQLPQIPESVDKIEVFPDGTWKCVDDTERRKSVTNPAFEIRDSSIRAEVILFL